MRDEFSFFEIKAGAPQSGFNFRLQMFKRRGGARARPQRTGGFAAEKIKPRKAHLKSRGGNTGERLMRISKPMTVGLANKAQRQVEILQRPPARALNAILER